MAAVSIRNSTLFADANLVSYWELDGNSNDSKGSNNGTDTNITYNASNGQFVQGAGFNGTTSKIVISDAASLKPTGNFTIMGWFKSSTTGVNQTLFQSYSENTNLAGFELYVPASLSDNFRFLIGKNTGTGGSDYALIDGAVNVCDGAFHFIAAVWNGTNLNLYVDGSADGTPVAGFNAAYAATNYVRIGCGNLTGTDTFFTNGAIDDVALFNRTLSSTEISNHWNGTDALVTGGGMAIMYA